MTSRSPEAVWYCQDPGAHGFLWAALSIRHYLVGFCSWWDEGHANKKLWWQFMTSG